MSHQIPTQFFDLGDVVCRFVPAERIRELALRTGRTERELHELVWESGLSAECDQGKYILDQMCRAINDAVGPELDNLTIIDVWRRAFVLDPVAFRRVQENVDCTASELMLIDGSRQNVKAATTLGWQTIHYVDPVDLAETLETSGVL